MRITSDLAHFNASIRLLNQRLEGLRGTQEQVASGKRINRPSDDISGMNTAMALRSDMAARVQEARNAADGRLWVDLADSKLQTVAERLHRVRELAIMGATVTNADERNAIAIEVATIRDDLVGLANVRHQGRGLFAGYALDDAVTKVAGVWTFTGDTGAVTRRIGEDDLVQVNVTADEVFGFTSGTDMFTMLDDLEAALIASDTAAIDASLTDIDGSLDTALAGLTKLGAAGARIENAEARSLTDQLTLRSQLGEIEDVDIAEAVMELQMQDTAYQAALAAFSVSNQHSLVDFLR